MTQVDNDRVHIGDLASRLMTCGAAEQYRSAVPFPHIVIDNALDPAVFADAVDEFPPIADPRWKGYLHVNEAKYANCNPDTWGPTLRAVATALTSDAFVAALACVTGFEGLCADWTMDGGGLHQTLRGGHLNVHTDFTSHHIHQSWARRVNLLVYFNESWSPEWGGALELWDPDVSRCARSVEPLGNRLLLFTTSAASYHGHPEPLACPPDVARRSLALYYFTPEDRPERRSTDYRARPGDGLRGVTIAADRWMLRAYDALKRRFGITDHQAHRVLLQLHRCGQLIRRRATRLHHHR